MKQIICGNRIKEEGAGGKGGGGRQGGVKRRRGEEGKLLRRKRILVRGGRSRVRKTHCKTVCGGRKESKAKL